MCQSIESKANLHDGYRRVRVAHDFLHASTKPFKHQVATRILTDLTLTLTDTATLMADIVILINGTNFKHRLTLARQALTASPIMPIPAFLTTQKFRST